MRIGAQARHPFHEGHESRAKRIAQCIYLAWAGFGPASARSRTHDPEFLRTDDPCVDDVGAAHRGTGWHWGLRGFISLCCPRDDLLTGRREHSRDLLEGGLRASCAQWEIFSRLSEPLQTTCLPACTVSSAPCPFSLRPCNVRVEQEAAFGTLPHSVSCPKP